MDDLISRQAAIEEIKRCESADSYDFNNGLIRAMNAIADIPSAQPRTKCIAEIKISKEDLDELVAKKVEKIKAAQPETPCYLGSPCEYQNPDAKMPSAQQTTCKYWDAESDFCTLYRPSAQPEITRCKDCKHSEHWYRDKSRCFLWNEEGIGVFDEGFCSYAERRTDETATIEPERKIGKWVRDNIYEPESGFVNPLICSECKCKAVVDLYGEYVTSDFCPQCGADMREE